ncbi:MAG: hypothetical protein ACOZCL_05895 [Bacillota bacterium]
MKKYLVKRFIESIDPGEMKPEDRDYKASAEELLEYYGMNDMKRITDELFQDELSNDLYMIKHDETGYYVETFSCVQNEEINEEQELFELFRFKLLKLDDGVYISAHDPEVHISEYEESILLVTEKNEG